MKKLLLCCLATSSAVLSTTPHSVRAQAFQPGEILVSAYSGGFVDRYSSTGNLEQTYTGTGTGFSAEGASLTPDGNLVTGYEPYPGSGNSPGVDVFAPGGTLLQSFSTTGSNGKTGDVSVFANGTIAVSDIASAAVDLYTSTGVPLGAVALPGLKNAFGSTVGADGILYVTDLNSTLIAKVDASGHFLGTINVGIAAADVVMNPADGTLWFTSRTDNQVHHVSLNGTALGSFATNLNALTGIGFTPGHQSLYVDGNSSTSLDRYDLNGNLLSSFTLTHGNRDEIFLTVVPDAPEPSTWAMLTPGLVGAGVVTLRRRRARA